MHVLNLTREFELQIMKIDETRNEYFNKLLNTTNLVWILYTRICGD